MQRFIQGFMRNALAVATPVTLASCANTGSGWATPSETDFSTDTSRTRFDTPHIRTNDYADLGFSMTYAYAQDNIYLLADQVVTVNGERSKTFGPGGMVVVSFKPVPNTQAGAFFKGAFDGVGLRAGYAQMSPEARELLRGCITGYSRYLKDTPVTSHPATYRNADWVRPLTVVDMMLMDEGKAIRASAGAMLQSIAAAQPPGGASTSAVVPSHAVDTTALNRDLQLRDMPIGSNGQTFGRATTDDGRSVLLGNPHFPWTVINHFYQVHLTVPSKLDVVGASIAAFPVVSVDFNKDMAWTHTVSTGYHFTLFKLGLTENDPTTYLVGGESHKVTMRTVVFNVKLPDGHLERRTHTFYSAVYGPVLLMPAGGMPWTSQKAYMLRDANRNNTRSTDTWLHIAQATDTAGIRQTIGDLGVPWANTVATDHNGRALFADVLTTPDISAETLKRCAPSPLASKLFKGAGLVLLDDSRSTCDWQVDPVSPVPGLVAPAHMPVLGRDDYVANNNDSSWLTDPAQRLTGFSSVMGLTGVPRRLRTRIGVIEIERRLNGTDGLPGSKVNVPDLQAMISRDANFAGHLVRDDLLAVCKSTLDFDADVRDGCAALAQWNPTSNVDACATHLFRELWICTKDIPHVYAIDFNPASPVHMPRSLRISDAAVHTTTFKALKDTVGTIHTAGFALDTPLSTVQAAHTPGGDIALHGGEEYEGVLNEPQSVPIGPKGLQVCFGTNYIRTVTFDDQSPMADALLTYNEPTNPASPHAFNQMCEFSAKRWSRLPFSEAAIAIDPALKVTKLSQ